ncbi:polyketide cyclase [Alkalibacterium sp. 20]|nr:polyketide cyclase [Alkalibacterium sp. 20]
MVKTTINENVKEVWGNWTEPQHITKWNQASDDWCTTFVENNLTAGGKFLYRMEAKDKSDGFNFSGTYDEVETFKRISYTLDDGRKVNIVFISKDDQTEIIETFEGEKMYSFEHQQQGWQSILDHFKEYTEITSR